MKIHSRFKRAASWVHPLRVVLSTTALMVLSLTTSAMAADPQTASNVADSQTASDAGAPALAEVVVQAEHISENSQRVPIAITTVSADQLQAQGAISFKSLSDALPALTTPGSLWANTYIRGVGVDSDTPNVEPAVATYIDGVYIPSQFALTGMGLNNIQQVSVLKGPQGTLFGRNTTGGVIQITTPDPQQQFSGNANVGYGNLDTITGSTYLTRGITQDLAADLAVDFDNQGHGYGYDPPFDRDIDWQHDTSVRTKWLYTPSDSTKVTTALDYYNFVSDGSNNQMLPNSFAPDDRSITFPGDYNCLCIPNVSDVHSAGAAVTVDQLFGGLEGVSISSFRSLNGYYLTDSADTPQLYQESYRHYASDYLQQELRLSNAHPGKVRWQAGVYFFGADNHVNPSENFGSKVAEGGVEDTWGNQTTRSMSMYGQATGEITTTTHLTLGMRYTDETLNGYSYVKNGQGVEYQGPFYGQVVSNPWTYRVALDHQFTPAVLGYVSYDHGFKSGGFNLSSPNTAPYYPEKLNSYQAGLKSQFLNNRIRLNVSSFLYRFSNLQVTVIAGNGVQLDTNAASAKNYGLDSDLDFAVTNNLTLSATASWLKAYYVSYLNTRGYSPLGTPIPIPDASGRELPYSPRFTSSIDANYQVPTTIGLFKSTFGFSYHDEYHVSPTGEPVAPLYFLLNASVGWWSNSENPLGVQLWGRNLTNAYYASNIISSSGGWYGAYAPPRTYGVTLTKDF
jgi:iron complex outermembrane recepter protein